MGGWHVTERECSLSAAPLCPWRKPRRKHLAIAYRLRHVVNTRRTSSRPAHITVLLNGLAAAVLLDARWAHGALAMLRNP